MIGALDYRIAGLNIRLQIPAAWPVLPAPLYSAFRAAFTTPDVVAEFRETERIHEVQGCLLYENSLFRVIRQDDKMYCYRGNYTQLEYYDDIRNAVVYCQQYSLSGKGRYITEMRRADVKYTEHYLMGSVGLSHIMADFRRVILHSSFVAYKGKAILFTAPSGTGKSTQAELWRVHRPGAEVINGDRSILSVEEGCAYAHGIPLCGTSKITKNCTLPIGAVIVLRQGSENRIRRLRGREAFVQLFSECSISAWSREDTETVTEILSGIISSVPVYLYACRPDSSAVDDLEETLKHTYEE